MEEVPERDRVDVQLVLHADGAALPRTRITDELHDAFGVYQQLLSIALANGGDYADLFFEYRAAGGFLEHPGLGFVAFAP